MNAILKQLSRHASATVRLKGADLESSMFRRSIHHGRLGTLAVRAERVPMIGQASWSLRAWRFRHPARCGLAIVLQTPAGTRFYTTPASATHRAPAGWPITTPAERDRAISNEARDSVNRRRGDQPCTLRPLWRSTLAGRSFPGQEALRLRVLVYGRNAGQLRDRVRRL